MSPRPPLVASADTLVEYRPFLFLLSLTLFISQVGFDLLEIFWATIGVLCYVNLPIFVCMHCLYPFHFCLKCCHAHGVSVQRIVSLYGRWCARASFHSTSATCWIQRQDLALCLEGFKRT